MIHKWAGSSAVEQEPFKLLVTGSNPVRLTYKKTGIRPCFFVFGTWREFPKISW